jgi:hypothetical protein
MQSMSPAGHGDRHPGRTRDVCLNLRGDMTKSRLKASKRKKCRQMTRLSFHMLHFVNMHPLKFPFAPAGGAAAAASRAPVGAGLGFLCTSSACFLRLQAV